jgi:UDP-N-acetylmuramate dehydrogenase
VDIQENISLAPCTTLKVGGHARWFIATGNPTEMLDAVYFARGENVPFFILGGGSNLLVSDQGFPGVVIHIVSTCAPEFHLRNDLARITADAGVEWDDVVRLAVDHNCAGIECLAGIPGSVGGTPVQNVGAYGQEVSRTISLVRALDLETMKPVVLSPSECGFAYRRSIFNTTHKGRYVITSVEYELNLNKPPSLEYRDVKQYFAERSNASPSLAETADAVRAIRARKGMLIADDDDDSRSAGSFFKNPIVPVAKVPGLAAIADCHPDEVPQFPAGADYSPDDAMVKLSAAWLIELAGFRKGYEMGNAGLSTKHVLAIVNRGGATASEIIALRDAIINGVQAKTAITLEQEPVTVGF